MLYPEIETDVFTTHSNEGVHKKCLYCSHSDIYWYLETILTAH